MEMKKDGMSDEEITKQEKVLKQDALKVTEWTLKEHFVFQKIAEMEKVQISEDELNDEIAKIAEENDESPRRVRARLEKEDALDALAAEMAERTVLDMILASAEYEDVPLDQEAEEAGSVATVEVQAAEGEMKDLTAPPVEETKTEA